MNTHVTGAIAYGSVSPYSKAAIRGFNATESLQQIINLDAETEAAIEAVYARQSQKYLAALKERVAIINTKNHIIMIQGGMGMCYISINDTPLQEAFGAHTSDAINILCEIEQLLDENWNWANLLIGQQLN